MPVVNDKLMQPFETPECFYEWLRLNHNTEHVEVLIEQGFM